ncbi:MAG TPA: alpha/beta fold hydrolase [Solirubrobacteraceae bacterium]|nr:alpha/beta fold hydrolase [Solirubrobacteraceae bacterium]
MSADATAGVHVVQRGEGAPLVLVHGVGASGEIWRRVVGTLARERRVSAADLPGFGASPPAGPGFALDAVADRLGEGLAAAGVSAPFDLVGHSLGGAVALTLAQRRPSAVGRLVLVAPAGLSPRSAAVAGALGALASVTVPLRRELGRPLAGLPLARRLLLAGTAHDGGRLPEAEARALLEASRPATRLREGFAAALAADLRGLLADLPTPVGFVWGERDLLVPVSGLEAVRAARPEAPARTLLDTGHVPMLERPHVFTAALVDVLDRLPPATGDAGPPR